MSAVPSLKEQHRKRQQIRTLTYASLLVGVWVAVVFGIIRAGEEGQQQRATDLVERLGGKVHVGFEGDDLHDHFYRGPLARPGDWLFADFHGVPIGDADLVFLRRAPRLSGLNLSRTRITDDGLAEVARHGELRRLTLNYTQITDDGLAHLEGLRGLILLELPGTRITDAGLVHLNKMVSLQYLDLRDTGVTDTGLGYLKGMPRLSSVYLKGNLVTDEGKKAFRVDRPEVDLDPKTAP
jgi:hypothetical protein